MFDFSKNKNISAEKTDICSIKNLLNDKILFKNVQISTAVHLSRVKSSTLKIREKKNEVKKER